MFSLYHDTVDSSKIANGVYVIKKNKKYIRTFDDDNIVFKLIEIDNGVNETLYIESTLKHNEWYYIGNECCSNILENPKKVDLNYIFFSDVTNTAMCYSFDLKKTLGKRDVIIKLVAQWQYALNYANTVVNSLSGYVVKKCFVGVITENNNIDSLVEEIDKLRKQTDSTGHNLPEFLIRKNDTQNIMNRRELKILEDFNNGKVFLNNEYYDIDIRLMVDSTYIMRFFSGILQ